MATVITLDGNNQPRRITTGQEGDGIRDEPFRLPITNTKSLTVPLTQHGITQPTSVTITDHFGEVIFGDTTIDPLTQAVSIALNKPLTGYLLIS